MRDTPQGLIEELLMQALEASASIGVTMKETLEHEAATLLTEWMAVLEAIRDGRAGPAEAEKALRAHMEDD